jgi:hypothetical protein
VGSLRYRLSMLCAAQARCNSKLLDASSEGIRGIADNQRRASTAGSIRLGGNSAAKSGQAGVPSLAQHFMCAGALPLALSP